MVHFLSLKTDPQITGGHLYNGQIVKELPGTFYYVCESPRYFTCPGNIKKIVEGCSIILADSIFFSRPQLLKKIFEAAEFAGVYRRGQPDKILLLHWLPWLEDIELKKELSGTGIGPEDIPPPSIGIEAQSLLFSFDRFIVTSDFTKNELVKLGIGESNICTAKPGIDVETVNSIMTEKRRSPGDPFIFTTLSHWTPVKGIHRLPEILSGVRGAPWEWHVYGSTNRDSSYGIRVQEAIHAGGWEGKCRQFGVLDPSAVMKRIMPAHCFLLPSLFETYGMAAAESAALGVPVIGMDVGGVSEAVRPGVDGILCKTLGEFKEAVQEVVENPGIFKGLNHHNREMGTWKKTAETVRKFIYQKI